MQDLTPKSLSLLWADHTDNLSNIADTTKYTEPRDLIFKKSINCSHTSLTPPNTRQSQLLKALHTLLGMPSKRESQSQHVRGKREGLGQ